MVVDVDASYFNVWAPASAGMALAEREAILLAHLQALFDDIDHIFTGSDEFSFALQAVKVKNGASGVRDRRCFRIASEPDHVIQIYHDAHILPLEPAKMGAGEALSLYGRLLLSMGDRKGGRGFLYVGYADCVTHLSTLNFFSHRHSRRRFRAWT